MLTLISSIPTAVREGFDVQDLPPRATSVSAEQMKEVWGGLCSLIGQRCFRNRDCCSRRCIKLNLFPSPGQNPDQFRCA